MNAKLTTIYNGKTVNHRGTVEAETWVSRKIDFLRDVYKFDDFDFTRYGENGSGDVYVLKCTRNGGKPRTRGAKEVTFILTII